MWGAGGNQPQSWAFNTNPTQFAKIATEQEKWAALAHEWIQMKSTGATGAAAGLEQTMQPPLPPTPTPTIQQQQYLNNTNNGNGSNASHNHEMLDSIGEAPMDLDDSIQQHHPVPQGQPPTSSNINYHAYHPDLMKPQIPPNPAAVFSSVIPFDVQPQQKPQQSTLPTHPSMSMQIPQQQFHHPQQMPLLATPRLLQPAYMNQGNQGAQVPGSFSTPTSILRRRPPERVIEEPRSSYHHTQHENQYEYSTETTNADIFEGIPRRSLPLWIREGLEKVEQEKKRLEQKERESELKKQRELERQKNGDSDNDSDEVDNQIEEKGYEIPKPYTQNPIAPDLPSKLRNKNKNATPVMPQPEKRQPSSPSLNQLLEGMSEDERLEYTMTIVRRQLTLILLDVTTDEMTQVAKESIARAKHKVNSTVQVRKTTALASLISGGPLGLGGYDSDSDSRGGGADSSDEDEQSENEQSNDSEADLIAEIEKKQMDFELKERDASSTISARANKSLSVGAVDSKTEVKQEKVPEVRSAASIFHQTQSMSSPSASTTNSTLSKEKPNEKILEDTNVRRRGSLSDTSSTVDKPEVRQKSPSRSRRTDRRSRSSERKSESKRSSHSHERKSERKSRSHSRERKSESKSQSHSHEKKSEIKSSTNSREKKSERKSRSRSRERKSERKPRSHSRERKSKRKSRSRERTSDTKHRSRSKSKDRKVDKKRRSRSRSKRRTSRSRSRDRKKSRRSRSNSSSTSSRRIATKRRRSSSEDSHDKSRRRRRERSSSSTSSSSSYTRRKRRRDRKEREERSRSRDRKKKSKKSSHRQSSKSPTTSSSSRH